MSKKNLFPWWYYAITSPTALVISLLIYKYEKIWLKEWVTKTDAPLIYYFALVVFSIAGLYASFLCVKSLKRGKKV